ncbi:MAG: hypothetical protein E6I80_11155 [Chloroflexi bacterium]|nr:MAG: hypothetical protein E6I80_11155 [Chloroflexota bacterium]
MLVSGAGGATTVDRHWTDTGGIGLHLGGEGQVLGLRNLGHLDLKLATYSAETSPRMVYTSRQ